ncbi:hypothetical protein ACFLZ4_00585 [Patescibacteria group bacterium]
MSSAKRFFTKDGKVLKGTKPEVSYVDTIIKQAPLVTSIFSEKEKKKFNLRGAVEILKSQSLNNKITTIWASLSVIMVFGVLVSIMVTPGKAKPQNTSKYAIYASKPLVLEQSTYDIYSKDSRAKRINEVFKMYNCPLEGMGEAFVFEADRNNIPWWLAASVSFQESSCGKNTPKVSGAETYNAWGWAVYGNITWSFDNWARGIETVSRYFGSNFYSKGVTDLCEIMKTYTPPSDGSWCAGVKHFGDLIQSYKTP